MTNKNTRIIEQRFMNVEGIFPNDPNDLNDLKTNTQ